MACQKGLQRLGQLQNFRHARLQAATPCEGVGGGHDAGQREVNARLQPALRRVGRQQCQILQQRMNAGTCQGSLSP